MNGPAILPNEYCPIPLPEVERLHHASLRILEETGLTCHHPEALSLFLKAGAEIDSEVVRIKPELVEWALKTVPKELTIYNRDLEPVILIGGSRRTSYYGVGSDSINIYDLVSNKRRKAVLEDIVSGMRLVAGLPNVHFVMSMFVPSDVSADRYERHQMRVMLNENIKPIVFTGISADSTQLAVDMATAVHGSEELTRRPFIINYVNTITAMKHNKESLQRLLDASRLNIPTIYAPGNSRGTSAPMTVAGMLALGNAGQLAGLVLSQLACEGSPFILNNPCVGALDMRTMVDLYVSPDGGAFSLDLAKYYGLAALCSGGASDAKVFDGQATADACMTLFSNTFRGANLIQNLGYLDSAMTGSLELVVFCNEIISWLKHYLQPLKISDDRLALDTIHQVAPTGDFLASDHTMRYFKEDWYPELMDRSNYDKWQQGGELTLQARTNAMARELVETSRVEPLPPKTRSRIDSML